ncbi:MAG: NAD(P)-dependent glycerol-3-phosphate dehydrogenase [Acidimicrobiia bacterium]|nr:NAD(P)-dependent glycerol-3-phosphate dehydrogenase [Acidimicrobiia bacterium]
MSDRRAAVIGAGSWGTAVASLVAEKIPTTLWARRPELAEAIAETHENPDYLPGYPLPKTLNATSQLDEALEDVDLVVMGVPSHGYRDVLSQARGLIKDDTPVISLTKGIETDSLMRMTEVTSDVLADHNRDVIGVLTGPNLAREIMSGQPAASVVAVPAEEVGLDLQRVFMAPTLRVYTNTDVVGCESAGALKNVMAIAAGMAAGLGYGHNSLATLLTRALAEITRLGVAMGGSPLSFAGLAGMGDLIATCMSTQSRNHRVGRALGEGQQLDDIIAEMNMVAEGVKTTRAVLSLADRYRVDMPIASEVGKVLYEGRDPSHMVTSLMMREAKPELHGIE